MNHKDKGAPSEQMMTHGMKGDRTGFGSFPVICFTRLSKKSKVSKLEKDQSVVILVPQ